MDETTEPIIAVIGHPIAGNPTQFALETGLQAAGIDCRVLSVDLSPDKIEPALIGMLAMDFKAVWVASSCRPTIENAVLKSESKIDLLLRVPPQGSPSDVVTYAGWYPQSLKRKTAADWIQEDSRKTRLAKVIFVNEQIEPSRSSPEFLESAMNQRLDWLNRHDTADSSTLDESNLVLLEQVPDANQIAAYQDDLADDQTWLIVIEQLRNEHHPDRFDFEIPARHTLIDLHEECDSQYLVALDRLKASSQGDVIRCVDLHARCLSELVTELFEQTVPVEVFQEAIDEYLAV